MPHTNIKLPPAEQSPIHRFKATKSSKSRTRRFIKTNRIASPPPPSSSEEEVTTTTTITTNTMHHKTSLASKSKRRRFIQKKDVNSSSVPPPSFSPPPPEEELVITSTVKREESNNTPDQSKKQTAKKALDNIEIKPLKTQHEQVNLQHSYPSPTKSSVSRTRRFIKTKRTVSPPPPSSSEEVIISTAITTAITDIHHKTSLASKSKRRRFIQKKDASSSSVPPPSFSPPPPPPPEEEIVMKEVESNNNTSDQSNKIILQIQRAKKALDNIEIKPLKTQHEHVNLKHSYPSPTNQVRKYRIITHDEHCFANSHVNDQDFILTLMDLVSHHYSEETLLIPDSYSVTWERICKIIVGCFNHQRLNGKYNFSGGEDSCVASLLDWMIEIAPTMGKNGIMHYPFSNVGQRRNEKTIPTGMIDLLLSVYIIPNQRFEIARKLLQFYTDLFYVNARENAPANYMFRHYTIGDTLIVASIKNRMLELFEDEEIDDFPSLHLDQKLNRELKNYSKLLACYFMEESIDQFNRFLSGRDNKHILKLPTYVRYSLFKHVFSFAKWCKHGEEKCLTVLRGLPLTGKQAKTLKGAKSEQLKVLKSGSNSKKQKLDEFELCKLYLILKASKKMGEEGNGLELSDFEMCKEFLNNVFDQAISQPYSNISIDYILGIKMLKKLRKFIIGTNNDGGNVMVER